MPSAAMPIFDTHKYVTRLKSVGYTEPQAEAQVALLVDVLDAHSERLASKEDVRLVQEDVRQLSVELRGEIQELSSETKQLASELRSETKQLASELRGEMKQLALELRGEMKQLASEFRGELKSEIAPLRWMFGVMATGMVGAFFSGLAVVLKNYV